MRLDQVFAGIAQGSNAPEILDTFFVVPTDVGIYGFNELLNRR